MVAAQLRVEGGIFEQEGGEMVGSFSLILNQFDGANTMHVMELFSTKLYLTSTIFHLERKPNLSRGLDLNWIEIDAESALLIHF